MIEATVRKPPASGGEPQHTRAGIYTARTDRFCHAITEEEKLYARVANWRMVVFLAAVGAFVGGYLASGNPPLAVAIYGLGVLVLGGFVVLVVFHNGISERLEQAKKLRLLNETALRRLAREWDEYPTPKEPEAARKESIADDLDLFGSGSLFHLVCTAYTSEGRATLADWFTAPASADETSGRRAAIAELGPQLDWRQELAVIGMELPEGTRRSWGEHDPWLVDRRWLWCLARILPAATFALAALQFTGFVLLPLWILPLLSGWILMRVYARRLDETLRDLRNEEHGLHFYAALFGQMEKLNPASAWLLARREAIEGASDAVNRLCSLTTQAAVRGSLVYLLLKAFLLWDIHVALGVERWRGRHREQIDEWFEALGLIESIASLAGLHHDEPDWCFPEFTEKKVLAATGLGHPLLEESVRVPNDVAIGPPGTFLFVSGSNMSGKSTLLRSIGLNVVLANAGAPVCAAEFQLPRLRLASSLRVQDSLAEGVSFFMAELQRIKQVVRMADRDPADHDGRLLLYLFDEILRGTNTTERRIIVQRVMQHLLGRQAIGVITSHDLALADIPSLKEASKPVHFRENYSQSPEGPAMSFDYRLRPGLATTTNALKLLELIDLHLEDDPG